MASTRDWTKVLQNPKYKGLWVALSGADQDKVIASGKSAREALERAAIAGHPSAAIMRVPEKLGYMVG